MAAFYLMVRKGLSEDVIFLGLYLKDRAGNLCECGAVGTETQQAPASQRNGKGGPCGGSTL